MKHRIHPILLGLSLTFACACGDFDINGDLDGMWHLRTVETLSDNNQEEVKNQHIYYSWQQHLVTVKRFTKENNAPKYPQQIGRFTHTGDSLILHNFVLFQNEDIIATDSILHPFYLDGTVSRYAIKQLDSDKMILRSKHRELTFKKF